MAEEDGNLLRVQSLQSLIEQSSADVEELQLSFQFSFLFVHQLFGGLQLLNDVAVGCSFHILRHESKVHVSQSRVPGAFILQVLDPAVVLGDGCLVGQVATNGEMVVARQRVLKLAIQLLHQALHVLSTSSSVHHIRNGAARS